MISDGVSLPAPGELDEGEVHEKLWAVIRAMHANNTFLYHTDHLSDRELYQYLWEEGLNESTIDLSGLSGCGCHHDLLGSGSEESVKIGLTFYDSPEDRAEWFATTGDPIPKHIAPPFDRDRELPVREY